MKNISGRMRVLASAVGLALSIISAIFTIKLLVGFATNGSEKLLYAGFGASVQTAQTVLYLYACFCAWKGEMRKAIPGFGMFCFLFCLSLVGTIGFFATTNSGQAGKAKLSDVNYSGMTGRMEQIDNQISIEQELLSKCPASYNKNCVLPREHAIESLRAERAELQNQIAEFKPVAQSDALYLTIAEFFVGENPGYESVQQIKFGLFFCYALALDLTSVVLLAYSIGLVNFMPGEKPANIKTPVNTNPTGGTDKKTDYDRSIEIETPIAPGVIYRQRTPAPAYAEKKTGIAAEAIGFIKSDTPVHSVQSVPPDTKHSVQNRKPVQSRKTPEHDTPVHSVQNRKTPESLVKSMPVHSVQNRKPDPVQSVQSVQPIIKHSVQSKKPDPVQSELFRAEQPDDEIRHALPEYVKWLWTLAKADGQLAGRKLIADKTGFSNRICNKCHQYLKTAGLIEVKNQFTYPAVAREQMMRQI